MDTSRYLAFNDPFWTDKAPYCDTVRLISRKDAILYIWRTHRETHGTKYPGTVGQAVEDFKTVHQAWECEAPQIPTDKRTEAGFPLRSALVYLRIVEFKAADHLPEDLMLEMTAAIDKLIAELRKLEALK